MFAQIVPDAAAVNVAHVPVVYQVPPLMMQPLTLPPEVTGSVPLPENGTPGVDVGVGAVVTVDKVVEGGVPVEPLGRYLIPVAGQLDFEPSEQLSDVYKHEVGSTHLVPRAQSPQSEHSPAHCRNTRFRLTPRYCTGSPPGHPSAWQEPH